MSTKNHPGRYNCFEAAGPDEEIFTLLGRDPLAPWLVMQWAKIRLGDPEAARTASESMIAQHAVRYMREPDAEKAAEAMDIALAMFRAQALEVGHEYPAEEAE